LIVVVVGFRIDVHQQILLESKFLESILLESYNELYYDFDSGITSQHDKEMRSSVWMSGCRRVTPIPPELKQMATDKRKTHTPFLGTVR
jgi:hypothetical protein